MKSMTFGAKNVGTPDEIRRFGHGEMAVVNVDGMQVGRAVFEPGWRWSDDVRPIANTASCQAHHEGYIISGQLGIRMDDGAETVLGPGTAFKVAPGHDAWVVGDKPCVALDWAGTADYARPLD